MAEEYPYGGSLLPRTPTKSPLKDYPPGFRPTPTKQDKEDTEEQTMDEPYISQDDDIMTPPTKHKPPPIKRERTRAASSSASHPAARRRTNTTKSGGGWLEAITVMLLVFLLMLILRETAPQMVTYDYWRRLFDMLYMEVTRFIEGLYY